MGLLGFQNRPIFAPKIVVLGGLNGPKPGQNPLKVVGRFAPHHFKWISARLRAV